MIFMKRKMIQMTLLFSLFNGILQKKRDNNEEPPYLNCEDENTPIHFVRHGYSYRDSITWIESNLNMDAVVPAGSLNKSTIDFTPRETIKRYLIEGKAGEPAFFLPFISLPYEFLFIRKLYGKNSSGKPEYFCTLFKLTAHFKFKADYMQCQITVRITLPPSPKKKNNVSYKMAAFRKLPNLITQLYFMFFPQESFETIPMRLNHNLIKYGPVRWEDGNKYILTLFKKRIFTNGHKNNHESREMCDVTFPGGIIPQRLFDYIELEPDPFILDYFIVRERDFFCYMANFSSIKQKHASAQVDNYQIKVVAGFLYGILGAVFVVLILAIVTVLIVLKAKAKHRNYSLDDDYESESLISEENEIFEVNCSEIKNEALQSLET